jgi:hypothetical protein
LFGADNDLTKGIAMIAIRSVLVCSVIASSLLGACGSSNPNPPATIVTSEVVVPDTMYGVVESIQLVQVVPPAAGAGTVTGTPVAPVHSTYQIGVRLNQGGYQVFTQDDAVDFQIGQQVRVDHGIVHHARI